MKKIFFFLTLFYIAISQLYTFGEEKTKIPSAEKDKNDISVELDNSIKFNFLFDQFMITSFVILENERIINCLSKEMRKIKIDGKPLFNDKTVRIINSHNIISISYPGFMYISTGAFDLLQKKDELLALLAYTVTRGDLINNYEIYKKELQRLKSNLMMARILAVGSIGIGAFGLVGSLTTGFVAPMAVGVINAKTYELPEKKIHFCVLCPDLVRPTAYKGYEARSAETCFLEGIFNGYGDDIEIGAIEKTVKILYQSGYDPSILLSMFDKLLVSKNHYLSKGYYSSLFNDQPDLKTRIEHTNNAIKKYNN